MTQVSPLETIFFAALEKPSPAERHAFLDAACSGDDNLRRDVERMLAAQAQAGSFLEQPVCAAAARDVSDPSLIGAQIGPYKLREQIGEGGMGIVYVAEQTEPVRRKVALKLIKPGMDTRQVVARFEAERQALAMMDHPNIAKVLDAGTTGEKGVRNLLPERPAGDCVQKVPDTFFGRSVPATLGQPYFVMELVQGPPITEYCDQHELSTRERLQLFLQVCRAVQHAHQKGIIHRDLKPSNVLVPEIDGAAVPKVIDFGVAKAVDQGLTEQTLYTQFAQMVGTPLYMSPEQAGLGVIDVDTRSDIYSLGVLLYELLTGTTPFDSETLKRAGFDEMRRIIREDEPPKPSTKISTFDAQALSTVAQRRGSDPRKLSASLTGELDWIVMKALEKDRGRRYDSVGSLTRDTERYLNDEPVQACPPSAMYRLQKTVRRHRAALVTVGLVTAALIVGAVLSATQAIRARHAERLAEKARAEAVANAAKAREAVDDMYTQVAERWLAHQPGMEPIQREFLEKALHFYSQFAPKTSTEPSVRFETALAFRRVGDIQHRLGRPAPAETAYRRAMDRLQVLADEFPHEPDYRIEQAIAQHKLGVLLGDTGRSSEEEQIHRRASEIEQQLLSQHPDTVAYRRNVGRGHWYLGQALLALHRRKEAESEFRSALALQGRLVREFPENPQYRHELAQTYLGLGLAIRFLDQLEEYLRPLDAAANILEGLIVEYPAQPEFRNELANAYYWHVFYREEQYLPLGQADQYLKRAIALQERLVADFPSVTDYRYDLFRSYKTLGRTLTRADKHAEALVALRQAASIGEKLVTDAPNVHYHRGGLAYVHISLGELFAATNRLADAESAYRQAIALLNVLVEESPDAPQYRRHLLDTSDKLAAALTAAGRNVEAEVVRRDASRIGPVNSAAETDIDETLNEEPDQRRTSNPARPASLPNANN